jgi:C2H2-type zinc finger
MSSSETNKPYKCEECGETFNSQQELQEHSNEQHIGTAWYFLSSFFTYYYYLEMLQDSTEIMKVCMQRLFKDIFCNF